jgi:hypothetical protein
VTYKWDYNPGMGTYFLMGPWVAPDGRLDHRETRQYAHVLDAAGGVYWACVDNNEAPTKFYDLDEAKAFVIASIALS